MYRAELPDGVVKTSCGLCRSACGVLVYIRDGQIVKVEGDPDNPLSRGELCNIGRSSLDYLYHPDRLKYPLRRVGEKGSGKWQQISWDEAIDTIADRLVEVKDNDGAEAAVFIYGAAKGIPDSYLTRFTNVFGCPNIVWQGHVCIVPRIMASRLTYGFMAVPDYDSQPATIIAWGSNTTATHHYIHRRITEAQDKGAKLIVIDPVQTELAKRSDLWLRLRPCSDLALALGMMNVIITEDLIDRDFVGKWTTGFDELKSHIEDYTPEKVQEITWVPAEQIRQAARIYAQNKPGCIQWGNAIDQGLNSFQGARALCILRAITGNLGIPGGEVDTSLPPLTGRRTPKLELGDKISPEQMSLRLGRELKWLPPVRFIAPQCLMKAILEEEPHPVRFVYVQAANPLVTYPNAQRVYQAFNKLDFLVVADLFMTPTAALADVVLPAASYLEFNCVRTPPFSYSLITFQQRITRIGECRSDYEILRDLARRLGLGEHFPDTEEQCLDIILEPAGLNFSQLKELGVILGGKKYGSHETDGFGTPSKKVEIYSQRLKEWNMEPLPVYHEPPETPFSAPDLVKEYPLILTNAKPAAFRHSQGRQLATPRGWQGEPVVSIHPQTADKLGIKDGDQVYIETRRGKVKQKAILNSAIDPRVVSADFAWWFPEKGASELYGWAKSNINILTDDSPPCNRELGSTNLKGFLCKVYKE
jgi:anaerobic selenocysteine-containing dehydrogenase